jgi:hypothetical protein
MALSIDLCSGWQALCSALVEGLVAPACVLRRSDGMVMEANDALTTLVTGRGDKAALVRAQILKTPVCSYQDPACAS